MDDEEHTKDYEVMEGIFIMLWLDPNILTAKERRQKASIIDSYCNKWDGFINQIVVFSAKQIWISVDREEGKTYQWQVRLCIVVNL